MAASEQHGPQPEDIRTEYQALVTWHNALVNIRFTIAGFFVTAMAFLTQAILQDSPVTFAKIMMPLLGALISLSVWILELRSRALYTNVAKRAIEIERRYWHNDGLDWYKG